MGDKRKQQSKDKQIQRLVTAKANPRKLRKLVQVIVSLLGGCCWYCTDSQTAGCLPRIVIVVIVVLFGGCNWYWRHGYSLYLKTVRDIEVILSNYGHSDIFSIVAPLNFDRDIAIGKKLSKNHQVYFTQPLDWFNCCWNLSKCSLPCSASLVNMNLDLIVNFDRLICKCLEENMHKVKTVAATLI